jgi:hypothetical protein
MERSELVEREVEREEGQVFDENRRRDFHGREQFKDFLHTVERVQGNTISPGGAAILLGYTRQRVHQLISEGVVRSWRYFESYRDKRPSYEEVSLRDLILHALRLDKVRSVEDLGMQAPVITEEFQRCKAALDKLKMGEL